MDKVIEHLVRVAAGLPSEKEERDQQGIDQLVALVNNQKVANSKNDEAAIYLAQLAKNEV